MEFIMNKINLTFLKSIEPIWDQLALFEINLTYLRSIVPI